MAKKFSDKRWHDNVFKGAKVSGKGAKLTDAQKKEKREFVEALKMQMTKKNHNDK